MDYIDYKSGQTEDNFYFKGKKQLIKILMRKLNAYNLKILDIGGGLGIDLDILNLYGEVYIIDTNQDALSCIPPDMCKEKKLSDATNLTYPDNYFDVVCSFDVFEHIKNDLKAIEEVYRVLKKGGYLIFTVPAFIFLYSAHDKALLHYRRYNLKSIYSLLSRFKILYLSFWNQILFIPLMIFRILKKRANPKTDYFQLPDLIEKLLLKFLKLENSIIEKGLRLPFGLSIIGYCKK